MGSENRGRRTDEGPVPDPETDPAETKRSADKPDQTEGRPETMTTYTPRYIVIRDGGPLSPAADLYELRTASANSTWTPDPLAPEYVEKATGSYADIRALANRLNERDAEHLKAGVKVTSKPAKVTAGSGSFYPCLYKGCRGLAEERQAFCPSHRPRVTR